MSDLMRTCNKWESCNAPICPLDDEWHKRTMTSDDSVCLYLREMAKIDSGMATPDAYKGCMAEESRKVIAMVRGGIASRYALIYNALERAGKTASKMKPIGE